jgi:predicted transcriptional regulator
MPRWTDVLLEIYKSPDTKRYCEKLNKRIHGSLTHIRDIVKLLAQYGFITITPEKKINKLELTEKGVIIIESILQIKLELR